jgi:hypothetical protein
MRHRLHTHRAEDNADSDGGRQIPAGPGRLLGRLFDRRVCHGTHMLIGH